ncbi:Lsr2 protein [Diaminobutyricimonas aerilata]|uniref:Lsr2 protein n=1 Tax=Diaminobutyricimonas aerilata TaxID=1162967 RepID=A0A2M9CMV3_9MICO|nr:Lsr2 family protein [Diaminobutyricimonas aerilata]PJJ73233.1 Lsr2 protein [Diaminobutyricimonas aerilata]
MAKRTIVTITDDLDGSEDAETVTFGFDGKRYEIDLSEANRAKLESALQPFIDAARPAGGSRGDSASSRPRRGVPLNLAAVRAWAADNGHEVNQRGRIPTAVIEAYEAAH